MKTALLLLLALMMASCFNALNSTSATYEAEPESQTQNQTIGGTWTQKTSMPFARYDMGIGVVDGKIYAIGGKTASGDPTVANQMYDPKTDTWTEKAPLPTLRKDFAIAVYQNKIYCIGGASWEIINIWCDYGWKDITVNEVYDPETDTWQTVTPMPTARNNANAAVANGLIYVVGGNSNATINEAYNPKTDTWNSKAPVLYIEETNQTTKIYKVAGYSDSTVVSLDGEMYWIGALWDPTEGFSEKHFMLTYNSANDSWSKKSMPTVYLFPKYAVATEGVWAPKQIYVVGASKAVYNAETGEWKEVVVPSRGDSGLAVVDDKIYCLGGNHLGVKVISSRIWGLTWIQVVTDATFEYLPLGYGTIAPKVTVVSPENNSHITDSAALEFSVNKPVERICYSIDGKANITAADTGNLQLTSLPLGEHNITVYAFDSFGNVGKSETVTFKVELAPTIIAVVAAAALAGVFVASLLIHRKRKRTLP